MFGSSVAPDFWLGYVLAAAVHIGLLINVVAVGALIFIWMERKVAGRIQDRLGPTRVGGKFGWLQTLADGIKLIAKEDITPKDADPLLFKLAPYVSFAASFTAYMALPFANGWAAQEVNVAVFFILAVLGLEVFGVILAGYASGSKWSLFGGMREAAQVVSYEVPIGLCVVVPVLIVGTMNLVTIGEAQAGLVHELADLPRSVHVLRLLRLFHLRGGQREPRPVRPGRSGKRAGRRLPHGILRPALELLLHGRVRLDVPGQRPGRDPVLRRLERADSRSSTSSAGRMSRARRRGPSPATSPRSPAC